MALTAVRVLAAVRDVVGDAGGVVVGGLALPENAFARHAEQPFPTCEACHAMRLSVPNAVSRWRESSNSMARGIRISVASGKGGTGKTTIATNLALALAERGEEVVYVDCDVEEPNGQIFLKPEIDCSKQVSVLIPCVDLAKCSLCGECSEICQYNAIAVLNGRVMTFPSLCHSCGGCHHVCPEKAIEEASRPIGVINSGSGQGVRFYEGRLNVGETLSPPITRALKGALSRPGTFVIDAPPGTSCPVIEALKDTDFVILVTEPTPFGLHDLELAVDMVHALNLPFGVVINRSDLGDARVEQYCRREKIDVMLRIPFDRKLAEAYAVGEITLARDPFYARELYGVRQYIGERVDGCGAGST